MEHTMLVCKQETFLSEFPIPLSSSHWSFPFKFSCSFLVLIATDADMSFLHTSTACSMLYYLAHKYVKTFYM